MGGSNSKVVDNITGAGRRQVAASSAVAERRFVTQSTHYPSYHLVLRTVA
jgi:hypothetical protein